MWLLKSQRNHYFQKDALRGSFELRSAQLYVKWSHLLWEGSIYIENAQKLSCYTKREASALYFV